MFFNYKEFSDWYAAKFQRNNPLPWQDGMNAILYYLSKSVPDNTRVSVAVTNSPTGVTISGKGIENDPYLWAFNFNKSEIEGPQGPQGEQGPQGPQGEPGPGLDDIISLDITPTFTAGGVAVDQTEGSENIAVDVKYGVDGEIPQIEGVLTLPFKAGDGIVIDVDEDNKRVVFKASGGSSGSALYRHNIEFECQPIEDSLMYVNVEIISKSNVRITMDNIIANAGMFRNKFTQPIDYANIGFQGSYVIIDVQYSQSYLLVLSSVSSGEFSACNFNSLNDTVSEF